MILFGRLHPSHTERDGMSDNQKELCAYCDKEHDLSIPCPARLQIEQDLAMEEFDTCSGVSSDGNPLWVLVRLMENYVENRCDCEIGGCIGKWSRFDCKLQQARNISQTSLYLDHNGGDNG